MRQREALTRPTNMILCGNAIASGITVWSDPMSKARDLPRTLSIMLVEDQTLTREYLRSLIDWEKAGCTIVAEAQDGKSALEKIEHYRPDVVFVDVVIPVMDGLEFSKTALKMYPWCRIVVLTSYQQFDYARRAISLGVVDYVLKHELNQRNLLNLIARLRSDITARVSQMTVEIRDSFTSTLENRKQSSPLSFDGLSRELALAGNLWIYASDSGQHEGSPPPVFPDFIGPYKIQLAAEIAPAGFLAYYAICLSEPMSKGNLPELPGICNELRCLLSKNNEGGNFIHVIYRVRDPRHTFSELAAIVSKVHLNCGIYPDGIVIPADELDSFNLDKNLPSPATDSSLIQRAREHIEHNYMRPIGTSDIAEAVGVSTAYLCQKFREESNDTILRVITDLRIERARRLLSECHTPVTDVASACGFSSSRYFSQVFKKMTGLTPTEFRERRSAGKRCG